MHERAAGDVNTMPLVFAGKMFFSKPDGDFMCSAQFISKNVLLTAAHCVRDDKSGDFWKNITFFLQYDKGRASAKYTQNCVATFDSWVQEGNDKYLSDFAMILVNEDSKTGWFGTEWDWQGEYKSATKIGYPVGIAQGEVIQVLPGPISVATASSSCATAIPTSRAARAGAPGSPTTTPRATPSTTTSSASSRSVLKDSLASTTARISTTASSSSSTT